MEDVPVEFQHHVLSVPGPIAFRVPQLRLADVFVDHRPQLREQSELLLQVRETVVLADDPEGVVEHHVVVLFDRELLPQELVELLPPQLADPLGFSGGHQQRVEVFELLHGSELGEDLRLQLLAADPPPLLGFVALQVVLLVGRQELLEHAEVEFAHKPNQEGKLLVEEAGESLVDLAPVCLLAQLLLFLLDDGRHEVEPVLEEVVRDALVVHVRLDLVLHFPEVEIAAAPVFRHLLQHGQPSLDDVVDFLLLLLLAQQLVEPMVELSLGLAVFGQGEQRTGIRKQLLEFGEQRIGGFRGADILLEEEHSDATMLMIVII